MSLLCLIKISAKSVIKRTLQIFEDWIENVAGEVVKSKQICYRSLQEVIEVALAVFPVYLHQPGRCDLTRCRTWFQFLRDVCYFLWLNSMQGRGKFKFLIWNSPYSYLIIVIVKSEVIGKFRMTVKGVLNAYFYSKICL